MNIPDTRRYEMLVRVRDFGAAHADLFPADSLGGQMFAAVGAAVATASQQAAAQVSSAGALRGARRAKAAARAELRTTLGAVRKTVRAVAVETPGLEGKFVVSSVNGTQAFVAGARAFAQEAQAIAPPLVAHGLPATFVDDLEATIAAFEATLRDHAAAVQSRVAARTALEAAIAAGVAAFQRLDAIVSNRLRDDPAAYARWERARHVEKVPRTRNRAPRTPTPPGVPPSNGAAAAA